jgi:uncharacterized membrane protein YkgB
VVWAGASRYASMIGILIVALFFILTVSFIITPHQSRVAAPPLRYEVILTS